MSLFKEVTQNKSNNLKNYIEREKMMKKLKWGLVICLCLVLVISIAFIGCKSGGTAQGGKYKIALSNSFMGNDWRQQMELVAQIVADRRYADKVDFEIVNCENTPEAQSDSIDALVLKGVDAIIIDSSSPTAINPAIERAQKAGVVIVVFDQLVKDIDTYTIGTDFVFKSRKTAEWMCKAMGEKGNICLDRGVPGYEISETFNKNFREVVATFPDVKITAEFDGMYNLGETQKKMEDVLATQTDITGVNCSYANAIINAYKSANLPMPVIGADNYNQGMLAALDDKAPAVFSNNIPGISALALDMAVDLLDGKKVEKTVTLHSDWQSTLPGIDIGVKIVPVEEGVNCWTTKPAGFMWPVLPEDYPIKVTADDATVKK
jgi:ribose transport system substrate-binding protein